MTEKYLMLNLITEEFEIIDTWEEIFNNYSEDIEYISEIEKFSEPKDYPHYVELMFTNLTYKAQEIIKRKWPEFLV